MEFFKSSNLVIDLVGSLSTQALFSFSGIGSVSNLTAKGTGDISG